MAGALSDVLLAHPLALAVAFVADLIAGDPEYRAHPVRLMGHALTRIEGALRRAGADGYGGGILLFVFLGGGSVAVVVAVLLSASAVSTPLAWLLHVALVYSLLALGDLLHHVWRVEREVSRGDLASARAAIARLVGRDIDRMDGAACRRAAVESLSESLTDGFTSAVFWYAIGGIPGLVVFKVVSTMDSMVGYKSERYLRFGWCGARLDDVMNYLPARGTWLLLTLVAACLPGCSGRTAFRIGLTQHAVLPGPNAGWSEAATAGAIERRIIGPIWRNGQLVTDVWIGAAGDPPVETREDVVRAMWVVTLAGTLAIALAAGALLYSR